MARIGGIHHVTMMAGDAQENLDFYADTLGMRLVKRSVNQDDPGTYHLFYADAEGHPGTDITFFPFPNSPPGQDGAGLVNEVALQVPPGSLPHWRERLQDHGVKTETTERFGDPTLTFSDPHGLHLALVETPHALERPFTPWERGPVPREHQVRGIHSVRILEHDLEPTLDLSTGVLGMEQVGTDGDWRRYRGRDAWSGFLEVRSDPDAPRGRVGRGSVHHVAWRVRDDDEQEALRQGVADAGLRPTEVIERFWFRSVYFREPGRVLFELATDGPGFLVDEPVESLGERLTLPPWLEEHRDRIEAVLPTLQLPYDEAAADTAPDPTE